MDATMRMLRTSVMVVTIFALAASAKAQDGGGIYVSPSGNDANDGLSPEKPFATLERAENEIIKQRSGTVFLMSGTYKINTTLMLTKGPATQRWTAFQGGRAVLDGAGQTPDAIRIEADHVTIDGLTFQNFARNGLLAYGAPNLTISGNHFSNISSSGWSQAAVMVRGNSPNAKIVGNDVVNTGYAAIEVFGAPGEDTSGTIIAKNMTTKTCQKKDDCGAIYVSGRTDKSDGTIIIDNSIQDYGSPNLEKTFGIYLDDFSSHMQVTGNIISGEGVNPILLHGGRGNLISGNTITVKRGQDPLWYFTEAGARQSDMSGNRFEKNIIRGGVNPGLIKSNAPGKIAPSVADNRIE
jgi:parallel beta-helix repeat protein